MNSYSSYHASSSSDILFKRFRLWKRQYLHVVIYTSLFWIFIDVFFIMLFSDCTKQVIIPCSSVANRDNPLLNDNRNLDNEDIRRHPKFNLNHQYEKNLTVVDRNNNRLNRRKNLKTEKPPQGFIQKWFGSGAGWRNISTLWNKFMFV